MGKSRTLKEIIQENNLSAYSLSKQSGVAYSTLADLLSGKTSIKDTSASVLFRLSRCLNVSMESLFLSFEQSTKLHIYNKGRQVILEYGDKTVSYTGPKNLIAFKEIRKLSKAKILHIDTWFTDEDGKIYTDEDFIDLNDIFSEYGYDVSSLNEEDVMLGKPNAPIKESLIDTAILVSDYMAIFPAETSTDNENVLVVNISRPQNKMLVRLHDYAVLSSNMKDKMEKRALASVKRNRELIISSLEEKRAAYA